MLANMSYGELQPTSTSAANAVREVNYAYGKELGEVLTRLGISVLLSTYQANKLVVVSGVDAMIELSFHNFDRPMGMAVDPSLNRLAVATRDKIWIANNEIVIARQLSPPAGSCFLCRRAHVTGDVQAHQLGWADDGLWFVNTRFSCLCTLDDRNSFVPRWRPAFVSELAAEDRCHLNGLATENGRPRYATALAQTDVAEGWRPEKHEAGCLIDVESNEVVAQGFAMPHSPVAMGHHVLLLDSGRGSLVRVTARTGKVSVIGRFPGYTRGLAVHGHVAVVGLSKIRETATFGNLPISERQCDLKCGFAIVDLRTGTLLSRFEFKTGVDEIFDIAIVPHPGRTVVRGPHVEQDGHETIWLVDKDFTYDE